MFVAAYVSIRSFRTRQGVAVAVAARREFDSILFVETERGAPDRGWDPDDVRTALRAADIPTTTVVALDPAALEDALSTRASAAVWPLGHTFGSDPSTTKVVEVVESLQVPFVGAGSRSFSLGSKLEFKRGRSGAGLACPSHQIVSESRSELAAFAFPAFVKTEFSCDSLGVRYAVDQGSAEEAYDELVSHRQRIFLEAPAGLEEWTIACIVIGGVAKSASLRFVPIGADYIDQDVKADNDRLQISAPPPAMALALAAFTSTLVARLGLDGYFRVDVLSSERGGIQPIDLNLLPFLNWSDSHQSYLPMAYILDGGISYDDVVGAILCSALRASAKMKAESNLDRYARSSRLVRAGAIA